MTSGADAAELRTRLSDPRRLCSALGLLDGYRPERQAGGGLIIRCPSHGEKNPSCSVTKGTDGTIRVRCFSCDFSGDALSLIAAARGLDLQRDFAAVLAEGAHLAGYSLGSVRDEPQRAARVPEPPPPPRYPPASEVAALWAACVPVTDDEQARAYLAGRAIDPEWVALLDLARVLPATVSTPRWASFRGRSWGAGGYRLIVPMVDHTGELRSLRAGVVGPVEEGMIKRVTPGGYGVVGLLMASPNARRMLSGELPGEGLDVVINEGEPDFLTLATMVQDNASIASLGMVVSGWVDAFADRVPDGARVVIRTHRDKAGDRYAASIRATLAARAGRVSTLDFPRPSDPAAAYPDDNELAQRGELHSHLDGVDMNDNDTAPAAKPARPWPSPGSLALRMEEAPAKLCTGVPNIDDGWRGGAPAGLLWVVGGAPGAGKTTWVTNLAHEWARHDVPVAYIAGDEPREGVLIRLGQRTGIDRKHLEEGAPVALRDLANHLDTLPLLVLDPDEDEGVSVETAADELRARWPDGPAVLVVDSLQALARRIPDDVADAPRAKVDAFMKACKAAAKRHQLVIILLSELARGAYRGGNEQTSDLAAAKESGSIEYEAGALCVLRPVENEPGLVSVSWGKSRPGRIEPFALRIDHKTATVAAVEAHEKATGKGEKGPEAAHNELLLLVVDLVKRSPGVAGLEPLRARLGKRREEVRAALHELLALGTIENRGGPHRPRLYWVGDNPDNDRENSNPPNPPQPARNQPRAGSGDGKPDAPRSNPAPKGADWAGRVSPGGLGTVDKTNNPGAGFAAPDASLEGGPLGASGETTHTPPSPVAQNGVDDPAPGQGRVDSEATSTQPASGVGAYPSPSPGLVSTTPPPASGVEPAHPANEAGEYYEEIDLDGEGAEG